MAIVDLLAILPFYLSLGVDLRGLRALRLLRIFRILKIARYSQALQTLGAAARRTRAELTMVGFLACIVIFISAMCLYYAERDAQPHVFTSIPASLWWAVVTLTTVGYGDSCPVTPLGKFVASIVMLTGIGLIAVPTGVLSGAIAQVLRERCENAAEQTGEMESSAKKFV